VSETDRQTDRQIDRQRYKEGIDRQRQIWGDKDRKNKYDTRERKT
jgi:hypothetical protein